MRPNSLWVLVFSYLYFWVFWIAFLGLCQSLGSELMEGLSGIWVCWVSGILEHSLSLFFIILLRNGVSAQMFLESFVDNKLFCPLALWGLDFLEFILYIRIFFVFHFSHPGFPPIWIGEPENFLLFFSLSFSLGAPTMGFWNLSKFFHFLDIFS